MNHRISGDVSDSKSAKRPLEENGDRTFPEAFLKRRRNLGRVSTKNMG